MDKKAQEGTDDADLANMLAGMNNNQTDAAGGLQFEEAPLPSPAEGVEAPAVADPAATGVVDPTVATPQDATIPQVDYTVPSTTEPAPVTDTSTVPTYDPNAPAADVTDTTPVVPTPGNPELEAIRQEALSNLRPLVDKLDLPPEEHFDTLLLVIRSTDDQSLVAQAFAAAKAIPDETRRAQALLDIIKEIDFFNSQAK